MQHICHLNHSFVLKCTLSLYLYSLLWSLGVATCVFLSLSLFSKFYSSLLFRLSPKTKVKIFLGTKDQVLNYSPLKHSHHYANLTYTSKGIMHFSYRKKKEGAKQSKERMRRKFVHLENVKLYARKTWLEKYSRSFQFLANLNMHVGLVEIEDIWKKERSLLFNFSKGGTLNLDHFWEKLWSHLSG